jgi:hypothetical protein
MKPLTTEQAMAEAGRKARRDSPPQYNRLRDRAGHALADKAVRESGK